MIETQTYDGAPGGSNLAVLPHEIPDHQARYIQDGFVDKPGLTYRRGVVKPVTGVATVATESAGLVQVYRPDGAHRVAVLRTTTPVTAHTLSVLSSDYTTVTDVTWLTSGDFIPGGVYNIVDVKPVIGGDVAIGTSTQLTDNSVGTAHWRTFGFWRGAAKPVYTTGNITVADTIVTGTGTVWSANVEPGMYLLSAPGAFGGFGFIGVVKSVESDTSLTLVDTSAFGNFTTTGVNQYKLTSVRGFNAQYSSGRITVAAGATNVIGSGTRFRSNLTLSKGTWFLFRSSDNTLIGTVNSLASDTSLVLAAGAAAAMDEESFVALCSYSTVSWSVDTASSGGQKAGFLSSIYKERQFYANGSRQAALTSRLWFSEVSLPESIDFDPEVGNFIDVVSTKGPNKPIAALASTDNALVILKENEAFGLAGDTPEQFTLQRLDVDDGALSTMAVQQIDGGVVWAGKRDIYLFDGTGVKSLVGSSLGGWYKDLIKGFDPTTYRMWSMMAKNHYMLFIESVTPTYVPIKGSTSATVTRMTISIYLPTGAVTFLTNTDIRGATEMPTSTGQNTWYVVNTSSGARICSSNALFDTTGADTITCTGNAAGPDFYMESKRYSLGDALRKKLFKEMMLTYMATGDTLSLDTLVGLNDAGITSLTTWAISSVFRTARIKFLKRSQMFAFRVYQTTSSVTSAVLGPWALGFKEQRKGRV